MTENRLTHKNSDSPYDQRWNNTAALTTLRTGKGVRYLWRYGKVCSHVALVDILYHHARSEYQESILKYGLLRSKSWAAASTRERISRAAWRYILRSALE